MYEIKDNQFDFSMTHEIDAPATVVYEVLADFESYPEFINDISSAKYEGGNIYKMVAKAALLTIPARVQVQKTPHSEVYFELIEGPVDVMEGRWIIRGSDETQKTEVELVIHAETGGQSEWLLRMAGNFVQNKTSKLIGAFTKRIEATHKGEIPKEPEREAGFLDSITNFFGRLWNISKMALGLETRSESATPPKTFTHDHQIETLEALAQTMIPPDDFDDGVKGLGFSGVAEMRTRYEEGRAELYLSALEAIDQMAGEVYQVDSFVSLSPELRTELLDIVSEGEQKGADWNEINPSSFFSALWEDVVFLYTTHPDTWRSIGWPGPSFEDGGYPDYNKEQEFLGQKNG